MATLNNNKIEFKGGELLPQVGSEAYKQAQSGIVPTSSYTAPTAGNSTITSSSMIDEKPIVLPETKPSTTSNGVIETVTTGNTLDKAKTAEETKRANEIKKLNAEQAGYSTDLKNILGEQATIGERKSQLLTDYKIPELRQQSDEITNQIEAKQLALRRQVEELQKNPQGLFGGGLQQEVDRINREGARELADLSIIQNARNRNLLTAESLVNQKIQLETEDLKTRADTLKFFYTENKDSLTKAEQRQFETLTKQADREYNETLAQKKELESFRSKYRDTAVSLGKGNDVLTAIQNAKSQDEIAQIASKNGVISLDDKIKRATLAEKNKPDTTKGKLVKIGGKDYIQNADGTYSLPKLPTGDVNNNINLAYKDKINQIEGLIGDRGLYGAVGPNPLARTSLDFDVFTGVRGDFIANVTQITNQATIDNLVNIKKAGGAFGALSEKELSLLEAAASKIRSWEVKDDKGNVVGYKTTEKSFKDELNKLKTQTERLLNADGGDVNTYLDNIGGILQEATDPYAEAGYNLN